MTPPHPSDAMLHIRKRPGMYFGSTGPTGLLNVVLEIVSNSFDLVLARGAGRISVALGADGSITVDDDGPGMQLTDRTGPSIQELFTEVRFTPTADGHWPHVHLAPVGVGLGPVSALCSELDLEVRRDGAVHQQTFARGVATTDLVRTGDATTTGTTIRLVPDPALFDDHRLDADALAHELREVAFLHPGLVTELVDDGRTEVFGPVDDLGPLFAHAFPRDRFPEEDPRPMLLSTEGDDFSVDLAMGWSTYPTRFKSRSYGNYRWTEEQGRHVDGIEEGLRSVFGHGPMHSLMGGLRAVVHVKLVDPVFPGPTRRRLVSPEAVWKVADAIADRLPRHLARRPELEADLRSRVPTRELVASGAYDDEELRRRRKTPI